MAADLEPVGFADLAGFDEDDCLAAFRAFRRSAEALSAGVAPTRPGRAPPSSLAAMAREEERPRRLRRGRSSRRGSARAERPAS
jgi:hypothetical protein